MSMIALVYVSFATKKMSDEALKELLEKAREKNQELDVTGMLLYRDGFFIQALEGEKIVVENLYRKIMRDSRHRRVMILYKSEISQRGFGDWSMGFNKLSDEDIEQIPGFSSFLEDQDDVSFLLDHPGHATNLLKSFKDNNFL